METQRLVLRMCEESDAEALFRCARDPLIGQLAGWLPHTSVEHSREVIEMELSQPETYAVCLKDGSPIGSIGLHLNGYTKMTDQHDECELGFWISRTYWGQGLIPEAAREMLRHAFEDLQMRAVWCGYYDGNTKSKRVQEKLGFVYQHKIESVEIKLINEVHTVYCNLMTKERWQNVTLFLKQKNMLDLFLEKGAISQSQYNKSLDGLRGEMDVDLAIEERLLPPYLKV